MSEIRLILFFMYLYSIKWQEINYKTLKIMESAVSDNDFGEVQKALPKPKKSILEIVKTIPHGRYKGLSKILEPHEIPKNRK